jgi:predicted nucleotidyltransferase
MLPDDIKEELVQGLTEIFQKNMSAIILYGSVARGDATDESDIDIAIIIKDEMDNQTKSRFISWAADMDIRHERAFSIVDIKEENMKKWERVLPFYQNIRKEGIVLWRVA